EERRELLVGEQTPLLCSSANGPAPKAPNAKRREPGLCEGTERPRHLAQAVRGKAGRVRRRVHNKTDVRLEEMPADLAGCRLQVLLTVMQAARRGVEGRVNSAR